MRHLPLLAFLAFFGCISQAVPPEAAVASQLLQHAAEANAQSREMQFDTQAENMRAMYAKQLDLILQVNVAKITDPSGAVPADRVIALSEMREDARKIFEDDLATERKKWLGDPNIKTELETARTLNQYMMALDEFARRFESALSKFSLVPSPQPSPMSTTLRKKE